MKMICELCRRPLAGDALEHRHEHFPEIPVPLKIEGTPTDPPHCPHDQDDVARITRIDGPLDEQGFRIPSGTPSVPGVSPAMPPLEIDEAGHLVHVEKIQNLANLIDAGRLHEVYNLFGKTIVSKPDVDQVRRLTTLIEQLPGHHDLVVDFPAYAALMQVRRADIDAHALDRDVLVFAITRPHTTTGLLPVRWQWFYQNANEALFGIGFDGVPTAQLLRQSLRRREQVGEHSFVGMDNRQRRLLISHELGGSPDKAFKHPDAKITLINKVIETAGEVVERWLGKENPADLLEMAVAERLNLITFKVADALYKQVYKIRLDLGVLTRVSDELDDGDNPDADTNAPWDRPLATGHADDRHLAVSAHDDASDHHGLRTPERIETIRRIETAIRKVSTEKVRHHLEEMKAVVTSWDGPRLPTNRDFAAALNLSVGRIKQLKEIFRSHIAE